MEEQEDQDQAPQYLSRVATEGGNRAALSEDSGAAQGSYSSLAGIESRSEVSEVALPAPDDHAPTNPDPDRRMNTFLCVERLHLCGNPPGRSTVLSRDRRGCRTACPCTMEVRLWRCIGENQEYTIDPELREGKIHSSAALCGAGS